MAAKTLDERIGEVSDNVMGVMGCLTVARIRLGDEIVSSFLDKVPEKGEALWVRFRTWRDNRSGMTFLHFIVWVVQN